LEGCKLRGFEQMVEDALHREDSGRRPSGDDGASMQKEIARQQDEIRALQGSVRKLQSELTAMRNSLSWKVTHPLRTLARRLPRLAAFGQRSLDRSKDLLVTNLPKRAAAALIGNPWQVDGNFLGQIESYQTARAGPERRIVLYTAILGEYDNLLLPERLDPCIDYVCFTDRPRNNYGVWQMRAAPYHHPDSTRTARWVKTHPNELFPHHDIAVWLDANIILKGDVHRYIGIVADGEAHLGLVPHPHRACFYEEAQACKRLRKDDAAVIDRQVEHYRKGGVPSNQPLFETGFMVVPLRSAETSAALHCWWRQIEQFSRRDQLALAWVIHQFPRLRIVPLLTPGASVRDHEDFGYFRHSHARALIVPDVLLQAGTIADPLDGVPFARVKDRRLRHAISTSIDIIVCVHNALADVRLCLEAARENLLPRHRIIVVNDCSDEETTAYLRSFAAGDEQVELIENRENLGYTRSANRGLAAGTADFRILLNSDTIVCRNWALKLLDAANRSHRIGIVGPLSNAAGAQSIPHVKSKGNNTAINVLPQGLGPADLDLVCEEWSLADMVPRVPLVHGFCLGVKKEVIDRIGLFDEENFKRFYGEENDYCFRAVAAGFELAIATNTFVFHRKSRSIDEEKRVIHMAEAWKRLRELYGTERILVAYRQIEDHPLLARIRAKAGRHFNAMQHGGRRNS